jgi:tetratricopeptide (TPR) repeat protein
MKAFTYILLLVLIVLPFVKSVANNDLEVKAEKLYAEKKYNEVIEIYETILKQGFVSPKLYYNLGNAYYKTNSLGNAIYNYELANKLQPNSADVKVNLKIASEKTIDKIETKENYFIGAIKSGMVNLLSTTEWAWFSILSFVSLLVFVFLFLTARHLLIKRIVFFMGIFCVISFAIALVLGYTALKDKQVSNFAIILKHESKIKEEPLEGSKTKFNLHEGTKVSVIETNENWTNIKLENGNEGWIKTPEIGLF